MIIWGGYYYDTNPHSFNTGGRYNPSNDSWTPTSTSANCPATGRYIHTAVWTGTEMIIWGGSQYSSGDGIYRPTQTGGKYHPTSDTWTMTSTGANCPSNRYYHTVVWTRMEMIIWGVMPAQTMGASKILAAGTTL